MSPEPTPPPQSTPVIARGSCHCGAVRYNLTSPGPDANTTPQPSVFLLCHCLKCQKTSGAAYNANLFFARSQFHVTQGEEKLTKYVESDTESGQQLQRHFCSVCGCGLFVLGSAAPDLVVVTSGSIDGGVDELGWKPTHEQFTKQKRAFVGDVEGAEAHESGLSH